MHDPGERITVLPGDCREVLATLADNSIDAVVTDPPYSLVSIAKRFGKPGSAPCQYGADGRYQRASSGFMGSTWDTGETAFDPMFWAQVLRVTKPGAHLLACGGTRTYHRLVCAIEDAGFEVRDCIVWAFGQGFPKNHSVSLAIDKMNGVPHRAKAFNYKGGGDRAEEFNQNGRDFLPLYEAQTDAARQWSGWGTALKPAVELVCLARRPLSEGTIAANVLKWGCGALNIDVCRIEGEKPDTTRGAGGQNGAYSPLGAQGRILDDGKGRWPANLILDGSDEVVAAFPDDLTSGTPMNRMHVDPGRTVASGASKGGTYFHSGFGDSGSAARFFKSCNGRDGEASAERRYGGYGGDIPPGRRRDGVEASRLFYTSKADGDDRLGSRHPTVKPLDLMQYLVRLVTPKGGVVLDPFAGTGTTSEAAFREGMRAVLIEREPQYVADIERRIKLIRSGPMERLHESLKCRGSVSDDIGPLFTGILEMD